MVFTAERRALITLLEKSSYGFTAGTDAGFDLAQCSDNEFNDWIGAQIRADVYGWVNPGRPERAADLARRDAELSHRAEGVYGAMAVAAIGAAIPAADDLFDAVEAGLGTIPESSDCAAAMRLGLTLARTGEGPGEIQRRYRDLSPVHTVNNLALVVWGLLAGADDFGTAIGDTVAAGWDTDCNGATVGALWGLTGRPIPDRWTGPWNGRIAVSLAGIDELRLDDLVGRTVAVAERMA
jgi:ADP-ribosylglycohydrolase